MNENATQQTEFVLRRLSDPFHLFGREVSGFAWLAVLIPVLVLGVVYVGWMYRRDARAVGWGWAAFLGTLRAAVYLLIAGVFLLPAWQTWEKAEKRSRVLVLLDVSPSVATVSDDLPAENSTETRKLQTRLDKVVAFLTDKQIDFLGKLLEQNPVSVYRFGARLDEEAHVFEAKPEAWDADRWNGWLKLDFKHWLMQGLSDEGRAALQRNAAFEADKPGTAAWASTWLHLDPAETVPAALNDADRAKLKENRAKLDKRMEVVRQLGLGTNVGESLLTLLNREANNMVQGVVLVSDGRSNLGSESALLELRARARKENVPVFTVLVGEDRQPVNIRITDVQTPEQTPPDEKFVIRAEIDGEGLPDQETKVFLDVYKPGEEKPALTQETTVKFQPGEPPHAQAEFAIDPSNPDTLQDLKSEESGQRELIEGEWKFVVRVPRDRREAFAGPEHVGDPSTVQVVKKPLRLLLVASGPMRDYQFLRTLFVREKDQKRAEVSVFLQNEGRDGRAVQDVEPDRMLNRFPTTLRVEDDPNERAEDRYYNLAQYDLIVAFDPDWSEFQPEQLALLQKWVDTQAGGLIVVAGPVNTFQLARDDEAGKLKPLRDLFPVVPGDSVLAGGMVRRSTKQPWRLNFSGANPDMEFLKLDDESKDPLAGWEEFFSGLDKKQDATAKHGFFNFYPVQSVKPGATVVASFPDPLAKMADGKEQPFLVTMPFGKGRVVFLGSGELWRLRQFREAFYERFWLKLGRWASAGSRTRQNRRGVLVMGRQFTAGNYVRLEAQLFGPSLEPLPRTTRPRLTVTASEGGEKRDVELTAKPSQGEWSGWFQARFLATKPGDYKIDLPIPSSSDVLRGKFAVKESNPELDNTRPDPGALYQMAGELDEILPRLSKSVADDVRARLGTHRPAPAEKAAAASKPSDSPKLAFTLATADAIPSCMTSQRKVQKNRGPVQDLWDEGPVLGTTADDKPVKVAAALLIGVGLLSVEWLTRKLLRLA